MKIWFPTIRTGSGSDVFTLRLAEALQRDGAEAVITWFPHLLELVPDLLRFAPAPPGTDVIHANSWTGFAFRRPPIPLVITVHHCVHDPAYAPYRNVLQSAYHAGLVRGNEARAFRGAAAVVAPSRFTAERVSASFPGVVPRVVHNSVDTRFFRPAEGAPAPSTRLFRLLFIGNPTRRKGFDIALATLAQLGHAQFELHYTSGLRGGSAAQPPGVRALGTLSRDELVRAYQECDALLFPSRYEGFGFALCEAMACGKPVIAADQGPAREIVVDKKTGLLVPMDDVAAFASAARYLKEHPQEAAEMGRAGRRRMQEEFAPEKMAKGYAELYSAIAKA